MTPRRDLISAVVMVIDGAFEQCLTYTPGDAPWPVVSTIIVSGLGSPARST